MTNSWKIEWLERMTTKVGDKFNATLSSSEGTVEGCTLWVKDWPTATLAQVVEGDLVTKINGQYTNRTLYPANKTFAAKPGAIKQAMETKAANISAAQNNKAEGIKISSTIRMAVDIVTALIGNGTLKVVGGDLQEEIKAWREWLWNTWDADDSMFPPFA